jgi:hypothetical protein
MAFAPVGMVARAPNADNPISAPAIFFIEPLRDWNLHSAGAILNPD